MRIEKKSLSVLVNYLRMAVTAAIFILVLGSQREQVLASVDLIYFSATALSDYIFLEWETAQEINHVGFYIQRGTYPSLLYQRIGSFIPSNDDPFAGGYYSAIDETVNIGVLYSYRLEIIDASGLSEYSVPVDAIILLPTPTVTNTSLPIITQTSGPSATITLTPRNTRTPTITPTLTRSPTPVPSATKVPTATPTRPTMTPTITTTNTQTPTTTLGSLSAFTQSFPLTTLTATVIAIPESVITASPVTELTLSAPLSTRVSILLLIVIILWLLLAGFLVYYLRRIKR